MNRLGDIAMPKGCISCTQFQPIGKRRDANRAENRFIEGGGSWPYGLCQLSKAQVWGTEICESFRPDELIRLVEVDSASRRQPMQVRQDAMYLTQGEA